jgi:hypothetical protein
MKICSTYCCIKCEACHRFRVSLLLMSARSNRTLSALIAHSAWCCDKTLRPSSHSPGSAVSVKGEKYNLILKTGHQCGNSIRGFFKLKRFPPWIKSSRNWVQWTDHTLRKIALRRWQWMPFEIWRSSVGIKVDAKSSRRSHEQL